MLKRGTDRLIRRPRLFLRGATLLVVALLAFLGIFGVAHYLGIAPAHAQQGVTQSVTQNAAATNAQIGLTTEDVRAFVSRVIRYFLGLLGIIAVLLFLYAGYLYLTAQGEPNKIDRAKKIMASAIIGLVIILSAYAIAMFIIALIYGTGFTGGGGGGGGNMSTLYSSTRGRSALGNGIIDYHYPEAGQTNVPRNTKIAITFKRPLYLPSIIKGYDDKGDFDLTNDTLNGVPLNDAMVCSGGANAGQHCAQATDCPASSCILPFELNTDNIRLITQDSLGQAGSGTLDEQFDSLYPLSGSVANPNPKLRKTEVKAEYDPLDKQTITFKPVAYLGSSSANVNYRVALRGGDNGVKIWDKPDKPSDPPQIKPAFPVNYSTGGYYWTFTTGTEVDLTPPKITWVVPAAKPDPVNSLLDRNQLLQIYFNEAIDPTTASGSTSRGFALITVDARCAVPGDCSPNFGTADYQPVSGDYVIGNSYQTVEFTPATRCDNVSINACGDPVYCLPKNSELLVTTRAATIGDDPPVAVIDNGVEDMCGNSLDGNNDGQAEGPTPPDQPNGFPLTYSLNIPPAPGTKTSDTVTWNYRVGSNVDLVPPVVTALAPPPVYDTYPNGYNDLPESAVPALTWSKTMSVTSIRTGTFDEAAGNYKDVDATLVLRAQVLEKQGTDPCTPNGCNEQPLEPPGFFVNMDLSTVNGLLVSTMRLMHPGSPFYKANDLGFTSDDLKVYPAVLPKYEPIARARLRDVKQNCFWPSVYNPDTSNNECLLMNDQTSCCVVSGMKDGDFLTSCSPRTQP